MTWGNQTDEHEARDQLTAFMDAGGTLIDTAHTYAGWASEELSEQQRLPHSSSKSHL